MIGRRWPAISIAAVVMICLGLATLPWIGKLGMEYDEAHFLVPAVKIAFGAEEVIHPPYGVTVAHRPLPFMTMPYVGALDAYVYAVAYRLFGTDTIVSRWVNLAVGALIFLLTYVVVCSEAGRWAAAIAMGLLLADVELILHTPMNYGPILLQQAFTMGALVCLQRWWKGASGWAFFGAVTLMAMAFHEKLTYLWILGPLVLGIALFYGKLSWTRSRWWYGPSALVWAAVLVSPILYFAFAAPDTFGFGKQSTHVPLDWRPILLERWQMFDAMLRGVISLGIVEAPPPVELQRGWWLHILFFAGLIAAVIARQRMALVLYLTAIGVWCANLLFPDAGRMHHLLLMAPFWQAGAAIGLGVSRRMVQVAACGVLLLAGWDAAKSYRWFAENASRTGGMHHWSDMTVGAARWLEARPDLQEATVNWGISRTIYVLTGGKSNIEEHYFDTLASPLSDQAKIEMAAIVQKRRLVWLISDVMPSYEEQWQRVAALSGHPPVQVAEFPSRNGRFHLRAYRFDLPEQPVGKWQQAGGLEFALPVDWRSVRFSLAGVADQENESIMIEWLDGEGKRLWIDHRPMAWIPHITANGSLLEFGQDFYPKTFLRTREKAGEARRVRIEMTLGKAKMTMPEIGLP